MTKVLNHRFRKELGQNFLHDKNVISEIVSAVSAFGRTVIEIGAGSGALTVPLASVAKKLIAYEIDQTLIAHLREVAPKAQIEHADFLTVELPASPDQLIVVGNLPYYITTDLLFKLFENSARIERAVLMVQKEYAARMLAKPGSSEYSKLSVVTQHLTTPRLLRHVPSGAFFPVPGVDSTILVLEFNHKYQANLEFLAFVQTAFSMRRKTLVNNLRAACGQARVEAALQELKLSPNIRPQELSAEAFRQLFAFLH